MRIICTQENLRKGLNITSRISSGSTTLPVLNNILLATDRGVLKLSSTNLEMGVNTWVRCKVEEEGSISVPARTFNELISTLPNDNITLSIENSQLVVESGNYKTRVKGLSADEFPLIPQVDEVEPVHISAKNLKTAISQVTFAAAASETQPEISGILFSFNETDFKLVATDRYRLAEKHIPSTGSAQKDLIVPNKAVQELAKILGNAEDEDVQILIGTNQLMFKTGESELISRLIEGIYPPYQKSIPQSFNTEATMETSALSSALRTAGIFTQTGSNIILAYEPGGNLVISSGVGDVGESKVNVPATINGAPGSIMFNHKYILDCLGAIGTKTVRLQFIGENSPGVISSPELPDYIYLVMPIKI
jgi:DNA polymerase III subunit beta